MPQPEHSIYADGFVPGEGYDPSDDVALAVPPRPVSAPGINFDSNLWAYYTTDTPKTALSGAPASMHGAAGSVWKWVHMRQLGPDGDSDTLALPCWVWCPVNGVQRVAFRGHSVAVFFAGPGQPPPPTANGQWHEMLPNYFVNSWQLPA